MISYVVGITVQRLEFKNKGFKGWHNTVIQWGAHGTDTTITEMFTENSR